MKNLLYIAYFFPPLGGAGVQRTLKFVRYLPEFGWRPTVLASRAKYWMQDSSLEQEVPEGTQVRRAPFWGGRLVYGSGKGGAGRSEARVRLLRRVARCLLVPDAYVGWAAAVSRLARRELERGDYSAVMTTSSPDSAHLVGLSLRRSTGLPWVADFRDPWTRRLSYAPPTRLHHRIHRRLESLCLHKADRIIVTAEETREDFLRLIPGLDPSRVVVITNGYDEDDFIQAAAGGFTAHAAPVEGCPILHAGQLNPERPVEPFLDGLSLFLAGNPGREPDARTLFLGAHYDRDTRAVQERRLGGTVRFRPALPHLDSVRALMSARILLLLENPCDRGRLILPGKVFEYVRSGRPILALVAPDGAAARLVRNLDAGIVADPARPDTVAGGIERLLSHDMPGPPDGIGRYERRELTRRLADQLHHLAPDPPGP